MGPGLMGLDGWTGVDLPGFREVRVLHRSERTLVLRARRLQEPDDIVLKLVPPEVADVSATRRLRFEGAVLADLDVPGVVRGAGIVHTALGPALELESVVGGSLQDVERMEVGRFLGIAAALARTLSGVHSKGIVHKDINPTRFSLAPLGEVKVKERTARVEVLALSRP